MAEFHGPCQQFTFESVLTCTGVLQHLRIETAFGGLEDDERQWQLREFCTELIHAVKHPSQHLLRLDAHLSQLLPRALKQHPSSVSSDLINCDEIQASNAKDLLARFPNVPQRLFALPLNNSGLVARHGTFWEGIKEGQWAEKYLVPKARSHPRLPCQYDPENIMQLIADMQDYAWENFFVTSHIDTNNMIFLLKVAEIGHQPNLDFAQAFQCYVNLLGELVDQYDALVDAATFGLKEPFKDPAASVQALKEALFPDVIDGHEQSLSILKAFLWSAWQRSIMLYFYYTIGVQLWHGSSSTWNSLLAVRGVRRLNDLGADDYRGDSTQYLCNWAFELLRTSRTSLALDFRHMISLFDYHFRGIEGRCIKGSDSACKGDAPESCQRFTGSEAKSQSLHATTCHWSCARIQWNEISYRQCENPRAVTADGEDDLLRYCKASSTTLAISHVWSHGQGGRPEDGINVCLHKRYCHLARVFGCDSYWIDSSCIPDDHQLRKEAIMSINDIFCHSKVTLISDKDLQSKSVLTASIEDLETLLSILLVCDWGVRAWTMLEAIRGNRNVHILCADDKAIRLADLLRMVHEKGAVDLAVLLGSAQHLLPSTNSGSAKPIEQVGHLLSQRHASRKDDEVTIWGLLSNLKAPTVVSQLWEARSQVATAFLMSSAPRIDGSFSYGWAPATPYIRPQRREVKLDRGRTHVYSVRYPSYDGRGSYCGRITAHGLRSLWLVHDVNHELVARLCDECVEEMILTQWTDRDSEVPLIDGEYDTDSKTFERPDYAKACEMLKGILSTPNAKARVVRPLGSEGTTPYLGNAARGEDFTTLVAICVCCEPCGVYDDYNDKWQWKGVYDWIDDSHPDWTVKGMLIV